MSADTLAGLLRDNAEEIVTQWSSDLKAGGLGKYAERAVDELESACRQCLDGYLAVLERGDHSVIHWFVHQEVRARVMQGFRASEIAREFVLFRLIAWPLVADGYASRPTELVDALARIDNCVDQALFELEDEYERAAQRRLEAHLEEMEKMNRRLEELSVRDPLTGLYNRRFFMDRLNHEFQRASRHTRPLSAVMLDIDHFKQVNDTFGHQVGDEVLRSVALVLVNQTRSTDITARYGGEEFIALLPETEAEGAMRVAEKLREAVAVTPMYRPAASGAGPRPAPVSCTINVGIAMFDRGWMHDPAELLRAVDASLYAAKNAGRNRVVAAWTLPDEAVRGHTEQ